MESGGEGEENLTCLCPSSMLGSKGSIPLEEDVGLFVWSLLVTKALRGSDSKDYPRLV